MENRCLILHKNKREIERLYETKQTGNRCITFYKNKWEIREVKCSPKRSGNKDITFIKTNSKQRRYIM